MPQTPRSITLTPHVAMLRRGNGLLAGARVRVAAPSGALFAEIWYWLDRQTDTFEDLAPYRVGMFGRGGLTDA